MACEFICCPIYCQLLGEADWIAIRHSKLHRLLGVSMNPNHTNYSTEWLGYRSLREVVMECIGARPLSACAIQQSGRSHL